MVKKLLIALLYTFADGVVLRFESEVPPFDADECITAVNISSAFSEACEIIDSFVQTNATAGQIEPSLPSCFLNGYDGTTWYKFTVPTTIDGGNPREYIISREHMQIALMF